MDYLYEKLKHYEHSGHYGFHMPGHKRNPLMTDAALPYGIDITEIEGFDDLHHAKGILRDAQDRAAYIYHAQETHFLINGSTAGLLCAILGCTHKGDRILMARNCHKSVYNAVFLNELNPVYIMPQSVGRGDINGGITTGQVGKMLQEYPDIKAVVLTSPTYDGVVSDVAAIAACVHRYNIPLILDEAHGAHFGFHSYFPQNGNQSGADIVIHSLHKTLPSLTQTALLHMNGDIADRERVRMYLHMLQSSSPSYVLMASIDECIRMLNERGREVFNGYVDRLTDLRNSLRGMEHLHLLDADLYDCSKLLILAVNVWEKAEREMKKYTGKHLYDELNQIYLLQMEMATPFYVVGMTSPGDTEQGMKRLENAVYEIDGKLARSDGDELLDSEKQYTGLETCTNEQIFFAWETDKFTNKINSISFAESSGYIAAEYAYVYPPGIPLAVPGERISRDTAKRLAAYEDMGFDIQGTRRKGKIEVMQNG